MDVDVNDPNSFDMVLLSSLPSTHATRFARMKAYGNHWRVENSRTLSMPNYDSGVACVTLDGDLDGGSVDHIGILKDIIKLDYGPLRTPIILFYCQWKKRYDNRGNSAYKRDSDGFLVVNFKQNAPKSVDPFVFPEQCTQVFYCDDTRPGWKVVIPNETRSRRVENTSNKDFFISTTVEASGIGRTNAIFKPPTGAILGWRNQTFGGRNFSCFTGV